MEKAVVSVATATLMGFISRLYMLRIDYRQYPSYPQGYAIHLSLGLVASSLGAVAIPALLAKDYTAGTFLALAATQFREVRNIERETLQNLEPLELVPRGSAYIEGIARVFEARNYLAGGTALTVSAATLVLQFLPVTIMIIGGVVTGLIAMALFNRAMVGPTVGDIARVRLANITFDGPLLKVEDIIIMNIGLEEARQKYLKKGIGIIIEPKDPNAKATLANVGQRQAIAHDVSSLLGLEIDVGEPEYTPLIRRNVVTGTLGMAIIPAERNADALLEATRHVPVLEASVRKPLESMSGRMADRKE